MLHRRLRYAANAHDKAYLKMVELATQKNQLSSLLLCAVNLTTRDAFKIFAIHNNLYEMLRARKKTHLKQLTVFIKTADFSL